MLPFREEGIGGASCSPPASTTSMEDELERSTPAPSTSPILLSPSHSHKKRKRPASPHSAREYHAAACRSCPAASNGLTLYRSHGGEESQGSTENKKHSIWCAKSPGFCSFSFTGFRAVSHSTTSACSKNSTSARGLQRARYVGLFAFLLHE